MRERAARAFFALTAALVTFGLVLQLILSVTADSGAGSFESTAGRVVNFFSFFTVQSNILVAVTTALLASNLRRTSTLFRTLRLDAVVAIAITGIVFHVALADLQELTGWDWAADFLLHTLSPILAVLGWVVFGPRGQITWDIVRLAVIFPVAWLAYALVRGAIVQDRFGRDYYPYPFLNAQEHGYLVVAGNAALVALLFLAISAAALALDRGLPGLTARAH